MCCEHQDHSCIRKVPVFEGLTTDEMSELEASVQSKPFKKGEFIFREGERSDSLFVLNDGLVKLSKVSDEGKEQIIRFLFPGDFFGQFALLQEKMHYAHAEVLEPSVVCSIQRHDLLQALERSPRMAYRFLLAVSERLQQSDEWMGTISLMETERRLAKLLLLFFDRNKAQPEVRLPARKKELAALIGTTPETLSRKLAVFEEQGVLSVQRSTVVVLRPELLRNYAG